MEKQYLDEQGLKRLVEYIQFELQSRDETISTLIDDNIILYGGSASKVID